MENAMDILTTVIVSVPTIIGAASLVVQGIAVLTKITPSTKDDEIASKALSCVLTAQRILDRLAFNMSAEKARQGAGKP